MCGGIPPARLLCRPTSLVEEREPSTMCVEPAGELWNVRVCINKLARRRAEREREIVVLWSRPCVVNVWWVIIIRPPPSPTDLAVAQLLAFTRHYHDHLYHHRRVLLERAEGPCWRQLMESCPFEDDGINFLDRSKTTHYYIHPTFSPQAAGTARYEKRRESFIKVIQRRGL